MRRAIGTMRNTESCVGETIGLPERLAPPWSTSTLATASARTVTGMSLRPSPERYPPRRGATRADARQAAVIMSPAARPRRATQHPR